MRLKVEHVTHYQYDVPVSYALQQVKLTAKDRPDQQVVHDWQIAIEGGEHQLHYTDHHGNGVDLIAVDGGSQELVIRCTGDVELLTIDGVIGPHRGPMPLWSFLRSTPRTRAGRGVRALTAQLGRDFASGIERAHALSEMVIEALPYRIGITTAETTAEQALAGEGGVCQDHAHIFIAAMRHLGHPARYVSGYLMMDDRTHQDATHAWAEAHFDHIGWVGFDISNGHSPDQRYIRVATGFDYHDAAPVRGMRYGVAEENLVVQLQVQQ
ncbi:transglutaminase family protein [Sphingopyxis sp. XHP0097]|jgi:transglutaminase-like putative cysteine protease|uniref:Transglutaminase family protein n=1 Tax=Sphingopyxis jiangsuensis TaxID=2871171 RepID=A0ABS7MGT3_9SPHN|nr:MULTISPECIES: transglutaminase family protein [Sphingopyxis]MBL0768661.1 transglutaminase family protein [Sphingopyxis lutea]MBY4638228.1 transglutaminase family protein [Sphingopyxis jiangsuensis]